MWLGANEGSCRVDGIRDRDVATLKSHWALLPLERKRGVGELKYEPKV
jgi:hypothetical protein